MPSNSPGGRLLAAVRGVFTGRPGSEHDHEQDDRGGKKQHNDRSNNSDVPHASARQSDQAGPTEGNQNGLQRQSVSHRAPPKRQVVPKSEDEKRLFGDYENPSDAVRIMKPQPPNPQSSSMIRSARTVPIHGSVVPRNTLGKRPFSPPSGRNQITYGSSRDGLGKRKRPEETKISDLETSSREGKATKRKSKAIAASPNQPKRPEIVTLEDDDDVPVQHSATRVPSKQEDVSCLTYDTNPGLKLRRESLSFVPEYSTVEKMVDPRNKGFSTSQDLPRAGKAASGFARTSQNTSPYFNVSSVDSDQTGLKANSLKAAQPHLANKQGRDSLRKSGEDEECNVISSTKESLETEEVELEQTSREQGTSKSKDVESFHNPGRYPQAATPFRQSRKITRSDNGSVTADSPDELCGENTVGLHRGSPLSSPRTIGPNKSSASGPPSSCDGSFDLPKSDIRPTHFTASRQTKLGKAKSGKAATSGDKDWSARLQMCRAFGEAFGPANTDIQCTLRLGRENKQIRIETQRSGSNLHTLATISLSKIVRIRWAEGSSKLCLHLSGTPSSVEPVLLDFLSERKAVECMQQMRIYENPIKVKQMESTSIDQLFKRQLESQQRQGRVSGDGSVSQLSDLEGHKRKSLDIESTISKRQRRESESRDNSSNEEMRPLTEKGSEGPRRLEDSPGPPQSVTRLPRTRSKAQQELKEGRPASPNSKIRTELRKRLNSYKERGTWERPLVYPPDGPKKATVEFEDLDRLDDEQFLNDNLISFYLRYLEYQMEKNHPQIAKCVYFFNTYFYASLTNTTGGKGRINYDAVKRWTSKVDIFNYDFLIVPINESAHWYTAIIVNLPNLERKLHPESNEGGCEGADAGKIAPEAQPDLEATNPPQSSQSGTSRFGINLDQTEKKVARLSISESRGTSPSNDDDPVLLNPRPAQRIGQIEEDVSSPRSVDDAGSSQEGSRALRSRQDTRHETSSAQTAASKESVKNKKAKGPSLVKDTTVPRIVTLDSLNLPHNPTIRNLQRYLAEEGKHKRQLEVEVNQGTKAKGIPTQNNWCDCGLFLLGYITKFLQEPRQFINKIINEEYKRHDQHEHWPEMNALRMRLQILELIIRLHKEQRDAQRGIAKANKTDRGGAAAKAFTSSKSPSAEASARQGLSSEDQSEDDDVSIATAAYHGDLRLDNPAVSKPSPSASGSGPDEPQSPGFEGDTQDSLIITRVGPAKSSPSTGDTNKRLESPRSTRVEVARTPSPARSVGSPMLRSSPRAKKQGQRMRVVIPSSQGSEH